MCIYIFFQTATIFQDSGTVSPTRVVVLSIRACGHLNVPELATPLSQPDVDSFNQVVNAAFIEFRELQP